MADLIDVQVPDVGGDEVEVIELCVALGDKVEKEDSLITVETDKASMDIPSPGAGIIREIVVSIGDKVKEGSVIIKLESSEAQASAVIEEVVEVPVATEPEPVAQAPAQEAATVITGVEIVDVAVPDIGTEEEVDVIEILVRVGDNVNHEDGLITVETDKATMDVPSPETGVVKEILIENGTKVRQGSLIIKLEVCQTEDVTVVTPLAKAESKQGTVSASFEAAKAPPVPFHPMARAKANDKVYASPSVRRIGREYGVDMTKVQGTGRKERILKEDIQAYVKYELSRPKATATTNIASGGGGLQIIAPPKVDFSKFGEIEEKPLTRIQKISGPNLHRNWVTIPHVTQFDEADITDVEAFRKEQNEMGKKQKSDIKITPLVFIMKAVAKSLEAFPVFNSSLSEDGEHLILKQYVHVGIAVDTPKGLVVPVVRDVNKKGIMELSQELMEISVKARDGKLKSKDMQGGCMTISSLGGIGGTAFTPIVNAPEVAILGVSKSEIKPKWDGKEFQPRLMLPLSLSYDHRVIDGALAARFSVHLSGIMSDIRKLIL
jgi:pyruvate dehydrogenase E2 component (dihydrolipoamide acetyltransferase)